MFKRKLIFYAGCFICALFIIGFLPFSFHKSDVLVENKKADAKTAAQKASSAKANKEQAPIFPKQEEPIMQENELSIVTNPDSLLVVVNKQRKLTETFIPSNLVNVNIPFSFKGRDDRTKMRDEAAAEKLFREAETGGSSRSLYQDIARTKDKLHYMTFK